MYYIIQDNLFREEGHDKLISCLERFEFPYEVVVVRPFIETVEFKTDRKDVFVFGSLKLARLSKKYGWNPGALVTKNHNYEVYAKYYKSELLNFDSRIYAINDDFEWEYEEQFIRPCLDSKVFTGKVFTKELWEKHKEYMLVNKKYNYYPSKTKIQVACPKKITQEVRFWIVGGKIITYSTYRRGSFLYYDGNVDPDAIEYAQRMIDIFQLARTFVIDIALTEKGWKIIECGSTSCAGFYDADMQKLIFALEDSFNMFKSQSYPSNIA
jgi:hypothetical protein